MAQMDGADEIDYWSRSASGFPRASLLSGRSRSLDQKRATQRKPWQQTLLNKAIHYEYEAQSLLYLQLPPPTPLFIQTITKSPELSSIILY